MHFDGKIRHTLFPRFRRAHCRPLRGACVLLLYTYLQSWCRVLCFRCQVRGCDVNTARDALPEEQVDPKCEHPTFQPATFVHVLTVCVFRGAHRVQLVQFKTSTTILFSLVMYKNNRGNFYFKKTNLVILSEFKMQCEF